MMDSRKRQDGIGGFRLFCFYQPINAIYQFESHSFVVPSLIISDRISPFLDDSGMTEKLIQGHEKCSLRVAIG